MGGKLRGIDTEILEIALTNVKRTMERIIADTRNDLPKGHCTQDLFDRCKRAMSESQEIRRHSSELKNTLASLRKIPFPE